MSLPKSLLLLLFILLLGACSTTRHSKPEAGSINEAQHQLALSRMQHWKIDGRLAFKSTAEKFSANLNWQQHAGRYEIKLTSFIGTSIMHMQGEPGAVLLEADDQRYQDSDASQLIASITGWNIPVEQLPAWLKGQVDEQDRVIFSREGLLQQLLPRCGQCDAWAISYSAYKQVDEIWLPHQIQLNNLNQADNLIKIRINQWTLN
jgi:outer membrane lipoprotein LolB